MRYELNHWLTITLTEALGWALNTGVTPGLTPPLFRQARVETWDEALVEAFRAIIRD